MKPENATAPGMLDDGEARRRAIEATGRSFVMEASAGTGKTHTLIHRILHLVLQQGPDGPPLRLSEICAITFTEKAAGEMKLRLRQYLEQAVLDATATSPRRARAREALNELETASISTFHSFAVGLLKEKPIEAGLDPHFSALDEIQSELYFKEIWESWIGRALDTRDPVLEKALRNGFRLSTLEDLARILRMHWLTIRDLARDVPLPQEQFRESMRAYLRQGKEFLQRARKREDKLAGHLAKMLHWLEAPDPEAEKVSRFANTGTAANWDGGKDTVQAVREFLRETVEFRISYDNLPRQILLDEVMRWLLEDFLREEWGKRKQADGLLDFDDQLYLARDLLRRHATVRHEFQDRYKTLLVDEFQDTDPLQLEIVLMLTSKESVSADPSLLRPEPGRLFIVGDPKQSIYRFRNADIETYLGLVDANRLQALGIERLHLTTNFRSIPSILGFVDATFQDSMHPPEDGGKYQPPYLAFGGQGARTLAADTPAVSLLGDFGNEENARRSTREFVEMESGRIARLIRQIHGSEAWRIQDSSAPDNDGWRAPRYGDMAILLPVLSHADALEEALSGLSIPYVLEGGKFYYARSEVSSAITVLRAVANPNDAVAVYGSLRSIFFGLSDEDLLQARMEGIGFDYRVPAPPDSPLRQPYEILLELHRQRHERRASETFEILLHKTGAREVLAVRGYQSLANLNKVGRTLRALQGEASFSQVIDLLRAMDAEGLAESESRLMEERSDAVRILSIHKSKGLDFPIVFIASLGLKKQARMKQLLADRHEKKLFALKLGARESGFQTASWDALVEHEKKREEAELVRLLYVGLTRARDHMILSVHTGNWKRIDGTDGAFPDVEGTRLKPLEHILNGCFSGAVSAARILDGAALDAVAVPPRPAPTAVSSDWGAVAAREYQQLQDLIRHTPATGMLHAAGDAPVTEAAAAADAIASPEEHVPESAQKRSLRLGTAFHEAMERVDFCDPNGLPDLLRDLARDQRLDPAGARALKEMVEICLASDLLERVRCAARAGGRILREIPFVRPVPGKGIEEGKIDLLFEEPDGWVLVDYKTDWVSREPEAAAEFFQHAYSPQINEYVQAMESLGVPIRSAYLLLARTGAALKML